MGWHDLQPHIQRVGVKEEGAGHGIGYRSHRAVPVTPGGRRFLFQVEQDEAEAGQQPAIQDLYDERRRELGELP